MEGKGDSRSGVAPGLNAHDGGSGSLVWEPKSEKESMNLSLPFWPTPMTTVDD